VHVCDSEGIRFVTIQDDDYPEILRGIHAPPYLLTAKGNTALLKEPLTLAIVGTRHPTLYSQKVVSEVVRGLGSNRFVIVSGFANGIDTAAHTAALDFGYATIAVLGCGINVDYPRENIRLRERMITSGRGLLLSEYLPGIQPYPANFPRRNRILSGLSEATAVMEAAMRSGSLVTAQCAFDQGRYLFAVPPADLFDPRYAGVVPLLRDGAYPLMSHRDILNLYYPEHPQDIMLPPDGDRVSAHAVYAGAPETLTDERHPQKPEPQSAPAAPEPQKPPQPPAPAECTSPLPEDETERQIVEFLRRNGPTYADDIARALDIDLSDMLSTLTGLELDGYIESLFGKQYRAV
jgi:DNA processing protein